MQLLIDGMNRILELKFSVICFIASLLYAVPLIANEWLALPSMPTARSEIYCAVLDDQIYVVGGIGRLKTLSTCEVLDVPRSVWLTCPDLPKPLHHVALASVGQKVYASGGYISLRFRADPQSSLWSLTSDGTQWEWVSNLPVALGEHTMTAVSNTLYLIGGRADRLDSNKVFVFDTETKLWSEGQNMPTARHSAAAALIGHDIWILGGRSKAGGSKLSTVEIYDSRSDTWRSGPNLIVGRGGHSAGVIDGEIHLFGGEQFRPGKVLNRHDLINPKQLKWRSGATPPTSRHGTASCVSDNRVYVIGGATRHGTATVFSVSKAVEALTVSGSRR